MRRPRIRACLCGLRASDLFDRGTTSAMSSMITKVPGQVDLRIQGIENDVMHTYDTNNTRGEARMTREEKIHHLFNELHRNIGLLGTRTTVDAEEMLKIRNVVDAAHHDFTNITLE